jgi:hypothetical protein
VKLNKIFSSPVTYIAAAYLAGLLALQAQEAVVRDFLIPGTIEFNVLVIVLMSLTGFESYFLHFYVAINVI